MLPKPLEVAVFALGRGELSEPLAGKEGALLFYVEDAVLEKDFPFDDVRLALRRLLLQRKRNQQILERAREITPPEGLLALSAAEVTAATEDALILRLAPLIGGTKRVAP